MDFGSNEFQALRRTRTWNFFVGLLVERTAGTTRKPVHEMDRALELASPSSTIQISFQPPQEQEEENNEDGENDEPIRV